MNKLLELLSGIRPLTKAELRKTRQLGEIERPVQLNEPTVNSRHSREELAHAWKQLEARKAARERMRR